MKELLQQMVPGDLVVTDEDVERFLNPTRMTKDYLNGPPVWWTAEQAAHAFNVTVREIEERYRPLMPPETVLAPIREVVHLWDFEQDGYEWPDELPLDDKRTDKFKRKWDHYPEGRLPDDNDGAVVVWTSVDLTDDSYDPGLEPVSIRQVTIKPRLYHRAALLDLRHEKVMSRRVKDLPPRGRGGRFTKRSA